jgi:hypothetical protein
VSAAGGAPAGDEGAVLYVYYKVPESALALAVAAAHGLQAALAADQPGLRCALLRRPELRDGLVTLMETYAGPMPADFEARLAATAAGWPALPAARFTERFVPLVAGGVGGS